MILTLVMVVVVLGLLCVGLSRTNEILKSEATQKEQSAFEQIRIMNDRKIECWKRISKLDEIVSMQADVIKTMNAKAKDQTAKLDSLAILLRSEKVPSIAEGG